MLFQFLGGATITVLLAVYFRNRPPGHDTVSSKQIHLITQWYFDKNATRAQELSESLLWNLENQCIDQVHLLQSVSDNQGYQWSDTDIERIRKALPRDFSKFSDRVQSETTDYYGRLLISEAFRYASDKIKGHVVILANLDIYFDESLCLLKSPHIDLDIYSAYFLSRYERPESENVTIGTQCGPKFMGSHDSIAFVPPLPRGLISKCDFELGSWGIESRVLWEMEQFGIIGRNPCLDVKSWHHHASQVRNQIMPVVNTQNKSSIAFPDYLVPQDRPIYPWEVKRLERNSSNDSPVAQPAMGRL